MNGHDKSRIQNRLPHPIITAFAAQLRAARESKGLSQRALGERTGLPQSHISQIENAGADIRMTSLITLAHALDLELVLIPRQLIPLLKSLSAQQSGATGRLVTGAALATLEDLKALKAQTARLLRQFDSSEGAEAEILATLHDSLGGLMRADMSLSQAKGIQDRIRHLGRPLNSLRALLENKKDLRKTANYYASLSNVVGTLTPIARDLRNLRNRFAHEIAPDPGKRQPAYQLENEEEDYG